jgi:hypothetical protein
MLYAIYRMMMAKFIIFKILKRNQLLLEEKTIIIIDTPKFNAKKTIIYLHKTSKKNSLKISKILKISKKISAKSID